MVIVGTRVKGRTPLHSMVPVDVIGSDELQAHGLSDANSILQALIPSFNVSAQPNTDAAAFMRPANLRGLAPDDTLVLINGKRWHRGAVITSIGGGISDGAQGPDLASLPISAFRHVEVLRDGAAAQYGSDAIAGVLNFELKEKPAGLELSALGGAYSKGDGETYVGTANLGLPLTAAGFANLTLEAGRRDQTSRSVQRPDAAAIAAAGNIAVANPAQVWGSPQVRDELKLFANVGLDVGARAHAYAFGNSAQRTVTSNFYFRNPNTRAGVYSADGGATRLVLDLSHPGSTLNNCDPFPVGSDLSGATVASYVAAQTARGRRCFLFNTILPGGFQPTFSGKIADAAAVAGVRGSPDSAWSGGWLERVRYDFSASFGQSRARYEIDRTLNASLGPDTPRHFTPGAVAQREYTVNADFVGEFQPAPLWGSLNVGVGAEARREQYEKEAGDSASYANGPYALQGASTGANGYGGISPDQAGRWSRDNTAAYVDLDLGGDSAFVLGLAWRHEQFQEFGDSDNYKVSFLWQLAPRLGVRGSYSTGFRAPTVGQVNNEQINTVAQGGGVFREEGTLATNNPVAVALGARRLVPETARNRTLGMVGQLGAVALSADYFDIRVADRLAISSTITIGPAEIAKLEAAGIRGAEYLSGINFLVNDFDTRTRGADLVGTWQQDNLKITGTFNHTRTSVVRSRFGLVGADRIQQLEALLPRTRTSLMLNRKLQQLDLLARMSYFGRWRDGTEDFGARYLLDLEGKLAIGEGLSIAIGGQNVLDTYPGRSTRNSCCGTRYDEYAPFGFNGAYFYLKLDWAL
jgi:iron complex outermembrane receptor protein